MGVEDFDLGGEFVVFAFGAAVFVVCQQSLPAEAVGVFVAGGEKEVGRGGAQVGEQCADPGIGEGEAFRVRDRIGKSRVENEVAQGAQVDAG